MTSKAENAFSAAVFRRISTRYAYTCSDCHERYPPHTAGYWKRVQDAAGVEHTTVLCKACFLRRNENREDEASKEKL